MTIDLPTPPKWNTEEAYALYQGDGVTMGHVGRIYGIAAQTVQKKFARARLAPKRMWTAAERDRLIEVYRTADENNVSLTEVAAMFGREVANVYRKANQLGLKRLRVQPMTAAARARSSSTMALRRKMDPSVMRPALGMKHTDETKRKLSAANRARFSDPKARVSRMTDAGRKSLAEKMHKRLTEGGNVYSRCKHGKRADLNGQFFRSSWEANYARFLKFQQGRKMIASWEYEPETFWFENIRRGVRSYLPDFKVTANDDSIYYVEVKGWMDAKSKTKLKRMAKYHPDIDLRVVGAKEYREIERVLSRSIPGWEDPGVTVTIQEAA